MGSAKDKFSKSIESILVLGVIHDYLSPSITAFDISEILRAQFVLLVSSLDFYIHEVVREEVLSSLDSSGSKDGLKKISIPLNIVQALFGIENEAERKNVLSSAIKDILSKDTYQSPVKIEQALGLIDVARIWSRLGENSGRSAEQIKNQLALIINRRNKIAHEADINFFTGEKEFIDKTVVEDCSTYIVWLVNELDNLVYTNNSPLDNLPSPS